MRLRFDKEKCCACGACAVACMALHDTDLAAGERPFRRVRMQERVENGAWHIEYLSESCRHCGRAPCMEACPTTALRRDEFAGFVWVEKSVCTGCGACISACPFGAMSLDKQGRAAKCDGCRDFVRLGNAPVCVSACPYGALSMEE